MLTEAWTQLRYHKLQASLWRTTARFVAVAAGRGSGKTELSRRRVVRFLPVRKPWPNPMYFYALPTVAQAKRVAWRPLKLLIPPNWIAKINESDMIIETVFGSSLYVLGMDKPQRAEGVQWDGGIIDESCDQKPGVFDLTFLPTFSWRDAWCWRIGVPKRHGVGAVDFKGFCESGAQMSFTWPSEDILRPEALAYAREHLDIRDYNEQYRANWEDASGRIFHAFNDVLNVSDQVSYDSSKPVCVGSDFNVDPMAWILGHGGEKPVVFDELFIHNTNTQETLNRLHAKYSSHLGGWEFYGDATGAARKTSAATSDYIQIRNDERFKGKRVFYPRKNPSLINRFAACNSLFCNAAQKRHLYVHPRCVNLIKDLKDRAYKEGTREPDDYGELGHITDGLGYWLYRRYPVKIVGSMTAPHVLFKTL